MRLIILLLLCLPLVTHAQMDSLSQSLNQQHGQALRWDNLEANDYWLAGVAPDYDFGSRQHWLRLAEDERSYLQLPADSYLRIQMDEADVTSLEVAVGNGSGLFRLADLVAEPTSGDYLLPVDNNNERVVRLRNSAQNTISNAVFISRLATPQTYIYYRETLALETETAEIGKTGRAGTERFWSLDQAGVILNIEGPARLQLQHRFSYNAPVIERQQHYRVFVQMDEESVAVYSTNTTLDLFSQLYLDGKNKHLGRLEKQFIEIPDGQHQLRLSASQAIWLRPLLHRYDDYLHQAKDPVEEIPEYEDFYLPDIWTLSDDQLKGGPLSLASSVEQKNIGLRMARDNRLPLGAMQALTQLKKNDSIANQQAAVRLQSAYSFYRDIYPASGSASLSHHIKPFSLARLMPRDWRAPARSVVKDLPNAFDDQVLMAQLFTATASGRFNYHLPQRSTNSQLRLLLQAYESLQESRFEISVGGSPIILIYDPQALPQLNWASGYGQTGELLLPSPVTIELPLQADVNSVQISPGQDVAIALQYRTSKQVSMTEQEYAAALSELEKSDSVYDLFLSILNDTELPQPSYKVSGHAEAQRFSAQYELRNHWQPLVNYLNLQAHEWNKRIELLQAPMQSSNTLSATRYQALTEQAERLTAEAEWLAAVEIWSELIESTNLAQQGSPRLARLVALQQLGEHQLAEQELLLLIRYPDFGMRDTAREWLLQTYQENAEVQKLVGFHASQFALQPNHRHLARLVQALAESGKYEMALSLALLLPSSQQPLGIMLTASYLQQWWGHFDLFIERLNTPEQQSFWRGLRAQKQGDYDLAQQEWQLGNANSAIWLDAMQQSLSILNGLQSPIQKHRHETARQWLSQQQIQPGPYAWQRRDDLIVISAGAANFYLPQRQLYGSGFLTKPNQPATLSLVGGQKIKLSLRLLGVENVSFQDDWLLIESGSASWREPLLGVRPSHGVQLFAPELGLASQRYEVELELPPGLHQLKASVEEHDALLQAYVNQPLLPLTVLPELSQANLPKDVIASVQALQGVDLIANAVQTESSLSSLLTAEVSSEDEAYRRLVALLWWHQQQSSQQDQIYAVAHLHYLRYLDSARIVRLWRRFDQGKRWQPITRVEESAGIQTRMITGWQPESTVQRVRKAMLPTLAKHEQRLSGFDALGFALQQNHSRRVDVNVTLEPLGLVADSEVMVLLELDDGKEQKLRLDSQHRSRSLSFSVAAGRHVVRMRIQTPQANLFVRAWLSHNGRPIDVEFDQSKRLYHVASHHEPVKVSLMGPLLVRIDRYQDDKVDNEFRQLPAGWQTVNLSHEQNKGQTLYRLFQRVNNPNWRAYASIKTATDLFLPPQLHLNFSEQKPLANEYRLVDAFAPRAQEDGSWAWQGLYRLREFDDEGQGTGVTEKYFELNATHRINDWDQRRHFLSQGFVRLRDEGDMTIGAHFRANWLPQWQSLSWRLDAELYSQKPEPWGEQEWSAMLKGRVQQLRHLTPKSRHLPAVELFVRQLSLSDTAAYAVASLDRDVYTDYKANHLYGWQLSDSYQYEPWRDTQFSLKGRLRGNEFSDSKLLDNAAMGFGWRQLWQSLQLDADYAYSRYLIDDKRTSSYNNQRLHIGLDWQQWRPNQRRWQVGVDYWYDFDSHDNQFLLALTWHASKGRAYRDFLPGEIDFKSLRRYYVPGETNNQLQRLTHE